MGNVFEKKRIIILLVSELVIMLALISCYLIKKSSPESMDMHLNIEEFQSDYITYEDGWSISPDVAETEDSITMLYGPYLSLPKGHYTLVVGYGCEEPQEIRPYAAGFYNYYIETNNIQLIPELNNLSYDFRIKEDIEGFEVRVYYNGQGNFNISSIQLYRNLNAWKKNILLLFLFFLVLDLIIINSDIIKQHKKEIVCLAGISVLVSLPLLIAGTAYGIDTIFHLTRMEGILQEIRMGHLPVRIQSIWVGANGYPVSIYYGDILLYFSALLRLAGFSTASAYDAYIFFINVLTVTISFFSFKTIIKDAKISIVMTLVYATENYRLMNVYYRDALGEYTAMTFLPMVAAAIYLIYKDEETSRKPNIKNALILAISMSLIIISHTLSILIVPIALIIFCLFNIRKTFRFRTISTFLVAILFTSLLTLFFIIPFIDYYLNVDVVITHHSGDSITRIQQEGINLFHLFAFLHNRYSNLFNSTLTLGIPLLLIPFLALIIWANNGTSRRVKVMTLFSIWMIFMSTDLFPWDWLAYRSRIVNSIANIQFPFRWLTVVCVSLTVLLGFLLDQIKDNGMEQYRRYIPAVTVILALVGISVFYGQYVDKVQIYNNIDTWDIYTDRYRGTYQGGEYLRVDDEDEPIRYTQVGIDAPGADAEIVSREGTTIVASVKTTDSPTVVHMPLANYKGYQAIDNKGNVFDIFDDENCRVAFNVPENYEGTITVSFVEPWYWRISEGISLCSWMMLILGLIFITIRRMYRDEHKAK